MLKLLDFLENGVGIDDALYEIMARLIIIVALIAMAIVLLKIGSTTLHNGMQRTDQCIESAVYGR